MAVREIKVMARVIDDINGCQPMEEKEVIITLSRTHVGFIVDDRGVFLDEDIVMKLLELYKERKS